MNSVIDLMPSNKLTKWANILLFNFTLFPKDFSYTDVDAETTIASTIQIKQLIDVLPDTCHMTMSNDHKELLLSARNFDK